MVDATALAALVTGLVLAIIGGVGTIVVLLGAIVGVLDWTTIAWLLVAAFVVGAGLGTYGAAVLASDLWEAVSDGGLSDLIDGVDTERLTTGFD